MTAPQITVLMAVYNGSKYLKAAVDSILSQSFTDFEFIIIDDGSTDDSAEILQSYNDCRIRLVHNSSNLGLAASLNKGLELARGALIARMDADDISRPERLARQLSFMNANRHIGVCGSWVRFLSEKNNRVWRLPAGSEEIRCLQFHTVGLAHPSVVMRKDLFLKNKLFYNLEFRYAQDFELWGRAIKVMDFANIERVLLDYRITSGHIRSEQLAAAAPIRLQRVKELGLEPTPDEWQLHQMIIDGLLPKESQYLDLAEQWLLKLQSANKNAGIYQEDLFSRRMLDIWFSTCLALSGRIKQPCRRCFTSPLWSVANASTINRMRALGAWLVQTRI